MNAARIATSILLLGALLAALGAAPAQVGMPPGTAEIAQAEWSCRHAILSPGECEALLPALRSHGIPFRPRIDPEEQRLMLQLRGVEDPDFHPTPEQKALLATPPERPWSDPAGRFSLHVPAGWRVDETGGTLRLIQGDTWMQFQLAEIMPEKPPPVSADPLDMAWAEARAVAPLVGDWKVMGGYAVGTDPAHPAGVLAVACKVPQHFRAPNRLMIFLVERVDANHMLEVVESSDTHASQAASDALWQLVRSVRFHAA